MKYIRQRKKNTVLYHFYVESKKIQQTSEYNKKDQCFLDIKAGKVGD